MKMRTVRKPGDKGIQAPMQKYGEPVCRKCLKTVELIVAEQGWKSPESYSQEETSRGLNSRQSHTRRVNIRISLLKTALRKRILAVGGMRSPSSGFLWFQRFRDPAHAPIVIIVALTLATGAAPAAADEAVLAATTPDVSPSVTAKPHTPLISLYGPNYLIIGPENSPETGNITSKFQLSFKYDTGHNIYLAYTQRIYWDLTRNSQPILDMSVQPELFYLWHPAIEHADRWGLEDARFGLVHESNGKDGTSSRSWNRLYVEPHFRWSGWFLEPRVWAILDRDVENEDIADYAGYADLKFGYETESRQRFTVTGRHGSKHGSLRLDFSLPIQSLFPGNGMRPWFYAQAWAGYGETLLYYNVRTYALRIGLEFRS